ncbi:Cytochrome P450 monooxygenase 58 [Exophiala dermatitidis]
MAWSNIFLVWSGVTATVLVGVLAVLIHDIILWKRMPPGPRPLPFIGNRLDVPKKYPWIKFEEWARTYGPIITVWFGRRPTVIISDPDVAVDLLEKRSNKYSSRPRFVVMGEIFWDMSSILVQPYGKDWSVRRKALHNVLTQRALLNYRPVQEAEATRLCHQLLQRGPVPDDLDDGLNRYTSSIVFTIAYGHRIDSMQSPIIRQRMKIMHWNAAVNVPGRYLAESFPILKHVPDALAPWKREVKSWGMEEAAANAQLLNYVREDMENAKKPGAPPLPNSLAKQLLEARDADPAVFALLRDRDFASLPSSVFGAGADTTSSTLSSAILAIVTNQNVLEAAHAELDAVVGPDRLPEFADEASLPYIRALCKEALRWRPVAVLGGTPHATTEADVYQGYYIPKGTNILGNSWAINRHESYYPNPDHFNPLRFLDTDPHDLGYLPSSYLASTPLEKGRLHPSKLGHSSFGWGRRICPGADLASANLFIALSRVLWCFDIKPLKGVVYDTYDYTDGFNTRPYPFMCEIKVRSPQHQKVLQDAFAESQSYLEKNFPLFKEHEIVV